MPSPIAECPISLVIHAPFCKPICWLVAGVKPGREGCQEHCSLLLLGCSLQHLGPGIELAFHGLSQPAAQHSTPPSSLCMMHHMICAVIIFCNYFASIGWTPARLHASAAGPWLWQQLAFCVKLLDVCRLPFHVAPVLLEERTQGKVDALGADRAVVCCFTMPRVSVLATCIPRQKQKKPPEKLALMAFWGGVREWDNEVQGGSPKGGVGHALKSALHKSSPRAASQVIIKDILQSYSGNNEVNFPLCACQF